MPVLDDLELFLENDGRGIMDIGTVNPKLRNKRGLFQNELPGLQMTVWSDNLELVKYGLEVIKQNTSLFEEVEA